MRKLLYISLNKLFSYAIALILLVTIVFFMIRITPGEPSAKYLSPGFNLELSKKIEESFHLNESLFSQYTAFIKNIFKGDFGTSYQYRLPVFEVIMDYLPFTILFAMASFIIQFTAGITLAAAVSKRKNSRIAGFIDSAALVIYSMPSFLIGIILIYIFSVKLNILPSADLSGAGGGAGDLLLHMILPLITLSLPGIVLFYKYAGENINTVTGKSFIKYLRAEGVEEGKIYRRHIIPNILPPLISLSAVELSVLLGGALVTEVLFNLPGMGRITVTAILQRDYPLIVASTIMTGVFVMLLSFIGEIARGIIDKRIKKEFSS